MIVAHSSPQHSYCLQPCTYTYITHPEQFTYQASLYYICWLLVVLFYHVSTLFGSFNAELNFKQFSLAFSLMLKQSYFKQFSLA